MTREEFIERIEWCELRYENDYEANSCYRHFFLCGIINSNLGLNLKAEFIELFKPEDCFAFYSWFGHAHGKKHLEERYFVLNLFKEVCLSEKLYEEF